MIRLLDEYFNRMIEVIFGHHGTVEQLIGDEIVALFGVPRAPRMLPPARWTPRST